MSSPFERCVQKGGDTHDRSVLFNPRSFAALKGGPLDFCIDAFAMHLSEQGYAKATAQEKIRLVADLSHWLHGQKLGANDLDEEKVSKFLQYRALI